MSPELARFDPADWSGDSDYQRWLAWDEARNEWAEANLPDGLQDWHERVVSMPDAPFDPSEI